MAEERTLEEIEREITLTRAELHDTLQALDYKLSKRGLTKSVSDGGRGMIRGALRTVRDNPMPFTLIGAGLAWMAADSADADRKLRAGASRARAKADHLRMKGGAKAHGMRLELSERADDATDWAREQGHRIQHQAGRVRGGFWSAFDSQPLAMGAAAFGLGLAASMAFPSTEAEDRFMGGVSDAVTDEARHAGTDMAGDLKDVARDSYRAAADTAKRRASEKDFGKTLREHGRAAADQAEAES